MEKTDYLLDKTNIQGLEIEEIKDKINTISSNVATNTSNIATNTSNINLNTIDINNNSNSISSLQTNQTTMQNDITTLQTGQIKLNERIINDNLLINGDFSINQRGQSVYGNNEETRQYPSGIYSVDRWFFSRNYNGTFTVSTRTLSTNSNGTYANLIQRLEIDPTNLIGKTVTFSALVSNIGTRCQMFIGRRRNNTETSLVSKQASNNIVTSLSYTFTNDWQSTDILYVAFACNGSNNDSCTIKYAKLEIGEIATPFSSRPYAEELAICQRYYQRKTSGFTFPTNELDRTPVMRNSGTIGNVTVDLINYKYCDAEIY